MFDHLAESGLIPGIDDVCEAVRESYKPDVVYAAGYRSADGSMGMFAGPTPILVDLTAGCMPPEKPSPKTGHAYIVKMERKNAREEPTMTPIAKWVRGDWRQKGK